MPLNPEECNSYLITKLQKNNLEVLNMLNVKYVIKQIRRKEFPIINQMLMVMLGL
jgi:hypothetical protein